MGVTESDNGPGSLIVVGYEGAASGTILRLYSPGTTFSVFPQSSVMNRDFGLAYTLWEDWSPGTYPVYANTATGPFSGGTDIAGPLNITWHAAPSIGIPSYPRYPAPTIVTADWSDAHPQPFLSWLPVAQNDPLFPIEYAVARAFDPGGPWGDALGLEGFGGYLPTSFTDHIGGSSGYVYYRITAMDAIVRDSPYTEVTIYRPPPVIPPPPPVVSELSVGPTRAGQIRVTPDDWE